jgi:hypothetical protein
MMFYSDSVEGTAAVYAEDVKKRHLGRMAKLVRIVGMLLQTKVNLFWSNSRH